MAVDRNQQGYPVRAVLVSEDGGPPQVQLSGSNTADAGVEITSKTLAFAPAISALQVKNVGGADLIIAVTDNGKTYTVPDGDVLEVRIEGGISEAEVTAPGKWYWIALA